MFHANLVELLEVVLQERSDVVLYSYCQEITAKIEVRIQPRASNLSTPQGFKGLGVLSIDIPFHVTQFEIQNFNILHSEAP